MRGTESRASVFISKALCRAVGKTVAWRAAAHIFGNRGKVAFLSVSEQDGGEQTYKGKGVINMGMVESVHSDELKITMANSVL